MEEDSMYAFKEGIPRDTPFLFVCFQEVPVKGRKNVIVLGDIKVEITLDFLKSQIDLMLQEE